MTDIQLTLMTVDEARATVDQIKTNLVNVRGLLFELHEREGWRALGYETWQRCITEEFAMSRQRAHQMLNAFMVDRMLAAPSETSTTVDGRAPVAEMPERHARELEPLLDVPETLREVYTGVQERTNGQPTAADYRTAVQEHLSVGDVFSDDDLDALPPLKPPEEAVAYSALIRLIGMDRLDVVAVASYADDPEGMVRYFGPLSEWLSALVDVLRAGKRVRIVR